MIYSSCCFTITCSSKYHRRFIVFISILLLNPIHFINGTPITKTDANLKLLRQKRETNNNYDRIKINEDVHSSEEEIDFEGLLGCKYDTSVCIKDENCFDDGLFGQCWNGKGSRQKVFAVQNGIDGLRNDQLIALEVTRSFLNLYKLDWKDYVTQCILLRILNDHHKVNQNSLQLFYNDCLNQDELLDEFVTVQQEKVTNRRQVKKNTRFYYEDPYLSLIKSGNLYYDVGVPLLVKQNEKWNIESEPEKQFFINDDDIILKEKPIKLIAEESSMNIPTKVLTHIKENHPSLAETLNINSNKPLLEILNPDTLKNNKYITNNSQAMSTSDAERYFLVEPTRGYIVINRDFTSQMEGARLLQLIAEINLWPPEIFTELNIHRHLLTFNVLDNAYRINASSVAISVLNNQKSIENQLDIHIIDCGIGDPNQSRLITTEYIKQYTSCFTRSIPGTKLSIERQYGSRLAIITLVTCLWMFVVMGSFILLYFMRRNDRNQNKVPDQNSSEGNSPVYRKNFRNFLRFKSLETNTLSETSPSENSPKKKFNTKTKRHSEISLSQSSTSTYIEQSPTSLDLDIMTGHLILSYMEDHLCNRHRLESEWESLSIDKIDEEQTALCSAALLEMNENKNRYMNCIPYDHTRVRLENDDSGDYINASKIFDSDPKCKYIATQGPMPSTTNAFWQMVWEQGSCVIVALTRPIENGITMCHHYWPVEGYERYDDFEVNLVSEHIWSDDYVVRSFYLKNSQTMETRTITQFHFLTWDELCNPPSAKAVLDFRRKVNKCCRSTSAPLIVHCNDGVGRTGTYILLDIVLNRIYRGAREINIAAALEYIRDQRAKMVKTKEQFEFVFIAVAEEVTDLLKTLS